MPFLSFSPSSGLECRRNQAPEEEHSQVRSWARAGSPTAPSHTSLGPAPKCQTLLAKTADPWPHRYLVVLLWGFETGCCPTPCPDTCFRAWPWPPDEWLPPPSPLHAPGCVQASPPMCKLSECWWKPVPAWGGRMEGKTQWGMYPGSPGEGVLAWEAPGLGSGHGSVLWSWVGLSGPQISFL